VNFNHCFKNIFEDSGSEFSKEIWNEFTRDLYSNATFNYYSPDAEDEQDEMPEWIKAIEIPVIIESGKMSENVYFLIQGKVHIMNKEGMYEYGIINEGGYFGDISALLDEPSEYGYYYNPHNERPILMLQIPVTKFLEICNKHPLCKEVLVDRATKRRQMFENYKTVILLRYMKTIRNHQHLVNASAKE